MHIPRWSRITSTIYLSICAIFIWSDYVCFVTAFRGGIPHQDQLKGPRWADTLWSQGTNQRTWESCWSVRWSWKIWTMLHLPLLYCLAWCMLWTINTLLNYTKVHNADTLAQRAQVLKNKLKCHRIGCHHSG